jgi:hypothetical protein
MNTVLLKMCVLGLCYTFTACNNSTTGRGSTLFDFQVKALIKKAENGDGIAQARLAEHYSVDGSITSGSEAKFWFEKCVKSGVPSCVADLEGVTFADALKLPSNSPKRIALLMKARDNLNRAIQNGYEEDADVTKGVDILKKMIEKEIKHPTPPDQLCKAYQICNE